MTNRSTIPLIVLIVIEVAFSSSLVSQTARGGPIQGEYFAKRQYVAKPLPIFAETKGKLPGPIYDENPLYVRMYWRTWELAFRNFYEPKPGSGFVSQFIDAAFNENIYGWLARFFGQPARSGRTMRRIMPNPGKPAKGDFVGWTGIVPILYFIEYAIGLKADALKNRLIWELSSERRCGCERFRFNGHITTLIAQPGSDLPGAVVVTVDSDGPFHLSVRKGGKNWDIRVNGGRNQFALR